MVLLESNDYRRIESIVEDYSGQIDLLINVPDAEFITRQKTVQAELKKRGLDLGIFYWYREMPGDGIYLTGYNPTIECASGLIGQENQPIVVAGPEAGKLALEVGATKGVSAAFVKEFAIPDEYYEGVEYASLKKLLPEAAGEKPQRIGLLTSLDLIPVEILETFKTAAGEGVEFIEADDILRDLRYEKSESEFACMAQADKIASAGARAMLSVLKPGLRETQVAAVADFVMKSLGADAYGVETIVNAGPRCRTVIGPASNRVIQAGEIVQIGCSPSYEGYKGVLRRAVVLGKSTDRQREFFDILNAAYMEAENALKDVIKNDRETKWIDLGARNYFAKHEIDGLNMKQFHCYSSAHGTGLTECLEPMVVCPDTMEHYGRRVGVMLDVGSYGHPNDEIAGGVVENAFGKDGDKLLSWSDLPVDVHALVGNDAV
jgi:Xaa-Pro aminopeptidase